MLRTMCDSVLGKTTVNGVLLASSDMATGSGTAVGRVCTGPPADLFEAREEEVALRLLVCLFLLPFGRPRPLLTGAAEAAEAALEFSMQLICQNRKPNTLSMSLE